MVKFSLVLVSLTLLGLSVYPAISISRWFSSSYEDLRFTLRRYARCQFDLAPLKDSQFNETDYLINRFRVFLDQTNYDNEQMANITALMDNICIHDQPDPKYPISNYVNLSMYNGTAGKENRCRAIDKVMDAMFHVLKRGAGNRSEPLDFSTIVWYPQPNNTEAFYNLTDLINTSWIQSNATLESVCNITDSIKEYSRLRQSKSAAQNRNQQNSALKGLIDYLESLLDRILGLQKRLYWESTLFPHRVSDQLGHIRDGIGKRFSVTRERLSSLISARRSNETSPTVNATSPQNYTRVVTTTTTTTTTTTAKPNVMVV